MRLPWLPIALIGNVYCKVDADFGPIKMGDMLTTSDTPVETLAELATIRVVEFHIGDPVAVLADRLVAVTHAPVPGFARRAGRIAPVEVHPWPWLCRPSGERIQSFGAWRRDTGLMILDGRRTDEAGPETGLVTLPAGTLGCIKKSKIVEARVF